MVAIVMVAVAVVTVAVQRRDGRETWGEWGEIWGRAECESGGGNGGWCAAGVSPFLHYFLHFFTAHVHHDKK